MKKSFIILIITMIYFNSFAQNKMGLSQIYAGYGIGNIGAIALRASGENVEGNIGQIMIGYKRPFAKSRFTIGLHASYCSAYSETTSSGYFDVKVFSFYSKFDYHWLLKEKIDMYSGIALGTTYFNVQNFSSNYNAPEKGNSVGLHLNIFGLRHQLTKNFSQFFEFGFMNLGFIQYGVAYNL